MRVLNNNNLTNYNYISDKGLINRDKAITMLHLNPLRHFKNFSIEEYSKLSDREIKVLRKRYNHLKTQHEEYYTAIENAHTTLAEGIKSRLDKLYGEGKYTVIVIGRSLSSVGKLLGYKIGEDNVKNIPMSGAQKYHSGRVVKEAKEQGKLEKFLDYLKSIHLSKEDVEKDKNRKFILIDYCLSGYSLQAASDLLQSVFVLGHQKNFYTEDVLNTCIKNITDKINIRHILYENRLKVFSFVKKCYDLGKIHKSIIKPSKERREVKLTWFNLLDKAMQEKTQKFK